ncbi:MAG: carboxypeptidase-like regulatory domain-containing protein [Anaerolineae bacterium]
MAFVPQTYNTGFVSRNSTIMQRTQIAQTVYKLRIVEANVAEGETYWKVIGVHHLLPDENRSNHNVFLEALDENGQRIKNPIAWAGWTWQGRRDNERADPVPLDKPAGEAAGNIALHDGQIVSVWINGQARDGKDKSDRVENLDIIHPDEPGPSGEKWNTIGHHSFYVVFQRTKKEGATSAGGGQGTQTTTSPGGAGPTTSQPSGGGQVVTRGVVSGQIANGRGYRVRLLQGNTVVAEKATDNNGAFRFDGVPMGVYRLEAVGPTLRLDNINVDASHLQINVNLSA